ncbi:MAG: glycosyltransferase family 4 protein [Gemmatimonas sp.]
MNVLMVVSWDNLGGVSAVVNNAAVSLKEQGHTVHFLFPGGKGPNDPDRTRLGFPAHYLYLRPVATEANPLRSRIAFALTFPSSIMALRSLIRKLDIDVVNVHFPGSWGVQLAAVRRLGIGKLVTSIHGADVLLNGSRDDIPHAGVDALFAASDAVVTPSKGFQNAVREVWPSARDARMITIPNGIDPAELGYNPSAGETALEPPYVQSILQLVPYKGPDILLRAFAEVCESHDAVRLRLIGDGPNRQEYESLAEALGIAHRVDFLGLRDRKYVGEALRGCALFVLPSRSNSESFGIAVAEAMALDRPVIGSNVGGLPELIEDGVTGLLVPQGDVRALAAAITRLLDDPEERQRMGKAAGQRVRESRLWKHTGARYCQLMQDVIAS